VELTEILKNEAWIEGEKRQEPVPLSDPSVFNRSIKIWEGEYEKLAKKLHLANKNPKKV
jgi:hypothetical protein